VTVSTEYAFVEEKTISIKRANALWLAGPGGL
jgi:hypothetical protein